MFDIQNNIGLRVIDKVRASMLLKNEYKLWKFLMFTILTQSCMYFVVINVGAGWLVIVLSQSVKKMLTI